MAGKKRKIPIAKRETKSQRAVTFSKRRVGLFRKAAELYEIAGAQIAVLATPPSGKHDGVYSGPFGHSHVDVVVDAFLSGRLPTSPPTTHTGFFSDMIQVSEKSDDADELRIAIEKIQTLKNDLAIYRQNREKQMGLEVLEDLTVETEESEKKKAQEVVEINVGSWSDNLGRDLDQIFTQDGEKGMIVQSRHDLIDGDDVFKHAMSMDVLGVAEENGDGFVGFLGQEDFMSQFSQLEAFLMA